VLHHQSSASASGSGPDGRATARRRNTRCVLRRHPARSGSGGTRGTRANARTGERADGEGNLGVLRGARPDRRQGLVHPPTGEPTRRSDPHTSSDLDAFEAAAAGDLDRVADEIRKDRTFVERTHPLGWTALHFAAFGGQPKIVELLLAHGAKVDAIAQNRFANTPLLVGLLTRQGEVARVLLAHGADVNFKQGEGITALHEAAQSGDLDTVRMLLDAGADPKTRSGKLDDGSQGVSPRDMAQKAGHGDVVALLVSRGA